MKKLLVIFLLPLVAHAAGSLASSYTASGTAGAGYVKISNQSVAPATPTSAGLIYFNSGNDLAWKEAGGFVGVVDLGGASRTITLSGSPTLGDWFDQAVKTTSSPSFNRVTSTVATGTAPFTVASTTVVANLNASFLGGATFAAPGTIGSGTPSAGTFTTLTATGLIKANGATQTGAVAGAFNGGSQTGFDALETAGTSGATFVAFRRSDATIIGSITRVTTTNAVAYNTSSDARLKTNIRDFTDSGRLIDSLRPRVFDWKAGGSDVIGFVAQEEDAADPVFARIGAVTVGDAGDVITYQWQRSDSNLVPILVAELKSLRARVAALEKK